MVDAVPDWDASEWLEGLKAALEVAGNGYMRCVDADDDTEEMQHLPGVRANRTSFAMLAIGTVMNKLAEAPGMSEHVGLVPLHDLTAALWDLGRGGQPTLLRPVAGVGKGGEHVSKRWVREQALLAVAVLEASGAKADAACKLVADALAKAGHKGRKKQGGLARPIGHKTVADWRTNSRQRDFAKVDPVTARFLQRNMDRLRARPDWPFSSQRAMEWVDHLATSDMVRSKI